MPTAWRWHLGDVLRKARQQRGLTIDALVEKTEINKATISALERDPVRVSVVKRSTLERLARGLGCSLADLEAEARRLGSTEKQEVPSPHARRAEPG